MSTTSRPVQPGEPAPEFRLPAVDRDGMVSLSDYRDKSSVLLALFRGLWCPFCRRSITQMGLLRDKLRSLGVEPLGVVCTTAENARRYFRYRPTKLPLVADSELVTHRAFGVPRADPTPQFLEEIQAARTDVKGELPEPVPLPAAGAALDRIDGFTRTERDQSEAERYWTQLEGQFLIDRHGVVRWHNIECAQDGASGLGKFPSEEELLAVARSLA
jgi:peroxiredoxin